MAAVVACVSAQAGCSDDPELNGTDDAGPSSSSSSSSGSPSDARTARPGCSDDETVVRVADDSFCCPAAAAGADTVCHGEDGLRAGDACTDEAPTAGAKVLSFTTDRCISETCTGDLETVTFNAETELVETQLRCNTETRQWESDSQIRSTQVLRVCEQGEVLSCGGGYGYGYYGGRTAIRRAIRVLESTCREGEGASAPCPVGDL